MDGITSENVEKFIRDHTTEKDRICLVTDHDHTYHSVVKNLKYEKTQHCLFHFTQIIDRKLIEIVNKYKLFEEEINKLKEYAGRIKSIFLADDVEDFIYRLNSFFKLWHEVPEGLKIYYNKKIVRDMHKLTQHLFDHNVPKTNNIIESKFSGAQQTSDKTRFKTIKGCLAYSNPITERQNEELKKEVDEKDDRNKEKEDIIKLRKSIKELFER